MALRAGTRLGPYEIVTPIGAGGMGEVYRARDTRLDRTVAIKVLASKVVDDPDRRQRFEREARTIASLNHPNICTLYDIGDHEGQPFIVMEVITGETLQRRLVKGPFRINEILELGIQLADALDAAHTKGVNSTGRRNTSMMRCCNAETETETVRPGGSACDAFAWSAAGNGACGAATVLEGDRAGAVE